jgi:hypothetical protein
MKTEKIFEAAAEQLRLCELTDIHGNKRIIQPYGIFKSLKGNRQFCCYQIAGFSSHPQNLPGWHNMNTKDFKEIKILPSRFHLRHDFDPDNPMYNKWYFRIFKPEELSMKKQ